MGDFVAVEQLAEEPSVVAANKAGREHLLAARCHRARCVEALAAGIVDALGHAHDGAALEGRGNAVGLVDRGVERNGENHGLPSCISGVQFRYQFLKETIRHVPFVCW